MIIELARTVPEVLLNGTINSTGVTQEVAPGIQEQSASAARIAEYAVTPVGAVIHTEEGKYPHIPNHEALLASPEALIKHIAGGGSLSLELYDGLDALGTETRRETIRARYEPLMRKKGKTEPLRWATTNFGAHTNLK